MAQKIAKAVPPKQMNQGIAKAVPPRQQMAPKYAKAIAPKQRVVFPLDRINLILMGIACFTIILGFVLMGGEGSTVEKFNPDIFSTRRIIVGPALAFIGFIFMGFGIIYRSKKKEDNA